MSIITLANQVLEKIVTDISTLQPWRLGVREVYLAGGASSPKEKTALRAIAAAEAYIDKHVAPGSPPLRFAPGQLRQIIAATGIDMLPSDSVAVGQLLKDNKRILQIGGGKGKGIIVLSPTLLEPDVTEAEKLDPDDPQSLLKYLSSVVNNAVLDSKELQKQVDSLKQIIIQKDQQIRSLNQQVNSASMRSWS